MPYTALPDMRMPYDNDGTLVYSGTIAAGAAAAWSNAQLINLQRDTNISTIAPGPAGAYDVLFLFFPEQREVTAYYSIWQQGSLDGTEGVKGSNDTTNGLDGTWETASLPGGLPGYVDDFSWRSGIKPISFTGPKKNVRIDGGNGNQRVYVLHLYGEAAGGQMAHDLIFLNQDDTPGVAYTAPEDFGDQPLGTTVVRQFRVKNTSATRTATNVNIQCNDADFAISTDNINWVVTINIASLGPGVESATYFVRCTTPAPGAALRPRAARIVVTCDAGFFG